MTERVRTPMKRSTQKIVTALDKFLMDQSLEEMFAFLQQIGVQASVSINVQNKGGEGHHRCKIFMQVRDQYGVYKTVEKYEGISNKSVRAAIARAIARFFILEEHDYHDYRGLKPDPDYEGDLP